MSKPSIVEKWKSDNGLFVAKVYDDDSIRIEMNREGDYAIAQAFITGSMNKNTLLKPVDSFSPVETPQAEASEPTLASDLRIPETETGSNDEGVWMRAVQVSLNQSYQREMSASEIQTHASGDWRIERALSESMDEANAPLEERAGVLLADYRGKVVGAWLITGYRYVTDPNGKQRVRFDLTPSLDLWARYVGTQGPRKRAQAEYDVLSTRVVIGK